MYILKHFNNRAWDDIGTYNSIEEVYAILFELAKDIDYVILLVYENEMARIIATHYQKQEGEEFKVVLGVSKGKQIDKIKEAFLVNSLGFDSSNQYFDSFLANLNSFIYFIEKNEIEQAQNIKKILLQQNQQNKKRIRFVFAFYAEDFDKINEHISLLSSHFEKQQAIYLLIEEGSLLDEVKNLFWIVRLDLPMPELKKNIDRLAYFSQQYLSTERGRNEAMDAIESFIENKGLIKDFDISLNPREEKDKTNYSDFQNTE